MSLSTQDAQISSRSRSVETHVVLASRVDWWVIGRVGLLLLFCAELVALRLPYDIPQLPGWVAFAFTAVKGSRPALVTLVVAVVLLSRYHLQNELRQLRSEVGHDFRRTMHWLLPHFGLLAILALGTVLRVGGSTSVAKAELWLIPWTVLAFGALVTWSFALLPPLFWMRWFIVSRREFVYGLIVGLVASVTGYYAQALWPLLQGSTFSLVTVILRAAGHAPSVIDPQHSVIGTNSFAVTISSVCSGIEGMALISCLVALYLWFYRGQLKFPQALLLLPIGIVAAWILNALRIAALIAFGSRFPHAGVQGFHSVVGWLSFNLLTCALIWGSWRVGLFTEASDHVSASLPSASNAAALRLVPLLAMVAASMFVRVLSPDFSVYYPLQMLAAAAVLLTYRTELNTLSWKPSAAALVLGGLASVLWLVLAGNTAAPHVRSALGDLSYLNIVAWTSCWIIGSVAIVPIVEELAFRDYLRRKLIAWNFNEVALSRFTWVSFVGSSLLFGAFRGEWLAGTAVGMIYALAVCRRGNLSDAVVAHATSNGLRCAYALALGRLFLPH